MAGLLMAALPVKPTAQIRLSSWTLGTDSLETRQAGRSATPEFQTVQCAQSQLVIIRQNHESLALTSL